ncbi:putative receptor-like protein kinase isoform X1 [Cinnamomum micranthum f. kanehirae]|uniref:Putative receptor-like protein kinase isoform X1 n=1 Tax=Cinnamomum micranthum f. kanehirae TaxID=337451 RepID=A0A3S3MW16_9MAGN|nr:putative receptor-like protein kinase isoform X1 [Cinnamomum micranthum f. kanehirae]
MKCFYYFKRKSKTSEQKSAPAISVEGSKLDNSAAVHGSSFSISTASTASSHRSIPALYEEKAQNLCVFSYSELRNATNDFSLLRKIGEGGFGSVYKGFIRPPNGDGKQIVVAIKKLNTNGLQGHKQWIAEVQFLGVVEHPNLVKLVGYCAVDGERGIQRLLVYEFMSNKSLEDHLFNRAFPVLPWNTRLHIILGAAQGLAYLHEELEVQVIYRDFKASNVLLDENFKPKLSDFGLAREGPSAGQTHVSTAVMGTYGYAAPEYIETGHLTAKSDVWSFGVVLYEILTGRRSLDRNRPRSEHKLLDWVKQFPSESKRFSMIIDQRLGNQYSLSAARRIAKLADSCLSKHAKERPKMSEVVKSLEQAVQSVENGVPQKADDESSATNVDMDDQKEDQFDGPKYSAKRMVHLAKLRAHADVVGRRRFTIMEKKGKEP